MLLIDKCSVPKWSPSSTTKYDFIEIHLSFDWLYIYLILSLILSDSVLFISV